MLQREAVENAIEALIALLDTLDGDPDLEPAGDELDFAAVERIDQTKYLQPDQPPEDTEDDDVPEEDDFDMSADDAGEPDDPPAVCDYGLDQRHIAPTPYSLAPWNLDKQMPWTTA